HARRANPFVQDVVDGQQVGRDLGLEAARQETEMLALSLDSRARQHEAPDPARLEHVYGERHGDVGLARPGRADAEADVGHLDGGHVLLLGLAPRPDAGDPALAMAARGVFPPPGGLGRTGPSPATLASGPLMDSFRS